MLTVIKICISESIKSDKQNCYSAEFGAAVTSEVLYAVKGLQVIFNDESK